MPDMSNDWNKVRYELDKSANFQAICNSPWYTDAVYEKFSDEEFARRHALARELMARDGLDALILCELAMTYMGYTAKIAHPVTLGRPTEKYNTFFKEVVVPGFKAIHAQLAPGKPLEAVRKAASGVFRQKGAQSRPIVMHGHDLITSLPFISLDEVKGEPYDMVMQPGMAYGIEITPVSADGTFGIFFSRSFAITEGGVQALTPYPVDEIIVAG